MTTPTHLLRVALILVATAASFASAQPMNLPQHPNADFFQKFLTTRPPADFKPTGLTKADYLKLIAGNVDYFKTCQNEQGAIIDPVSKGERQYSTPAFAAAAALLVVEANRTDLQEPATKALTFALNAVLAKKAADNHADFYPPMMVHAFRCLKKVAKPEQIAEWEALFKKIDPETMYRRDQYHGNWNIVSSSGEFLRRHDGLIADSDKAKQLAYLETRFAHHLTEFTPLGMYIDPNAPLAYDAFPRLWMEDVFADSAFDSKLAEKFEPLLRTGGLSTLLLLSPTGEWASGGRSALHNWNECQVAAICEINATYWKKNNNPVLAGAFKRAARLCLQSATRWQRPSGELNIVKNRAEPDQRHGYEGYSHHSQYNLLPMSMLAIAYLRADESITETPTPSEVGGYVFDVRDAFHKIAAAAGGYYILIDTAADPHYNATGLQRVHRVGVPFPALNDSSAADRNYSQKTTAKLALSPSLTWQQGDQTLSLSDFTFTDAKHLSKTPISKVEFATSQSTPSHTAFKVTYQVSAGPTTHTLTEQYDLTAAGVKQTLQLDTAPTSLQLPILVSDGAEDTKVTIAETSIDITLRGSTTSINLEGITAPLKLSPEKIITHSGYIQKATAPVNSDKVTLTYTLK